MFWVAFNKLFSYIKALVKLISHTLESLLVSEQLSRNTVAVDSVLKTLSAASWKRKRCKVVQFEKTGQ